MARTKSVEYWQPTTKAKANSKSEAMAWGRVAARFGWGLDSLALEVDEQFHEVARQAYEKRLGQLGAIAS